MLKYLPISLVILRFAISPLLLLDAIDSQMSNWFLWAFGIAFVSDIVDGMIARRLGISDAPLRQADSWADRCLYLSLVICAVAFYRPLLLPFTIPFIALVVGQLALFALCLVKYQQLPSYHGYSAKIWGLGLAVAIIALFGFQETGIYLWLAIALGWVNTIEEILMTLILPEWTHDLKSLYHAWQLTKQSEQSVS